MKREKTTPSIPSLNQISPFDLLDDPCLHRLVAASGWYARNAVKF